MATTFQGFKSSDGREIHSRLTKLLRQTNGENDRTVVLLIASFAEESLGELLTAFLNKTKNISKLLKGPTAPLSSFSNRIEMAYALGLLTDEQHKDLDIIRDVRNTFAHRWEIVAFDDERVVNQVKKISVPSSIVDLGANTLSECIRIRCSIILLEIICLKDQLNSDGFRLPMMMGNILLGTPQRIPESEAP